MTPLRLAAIGAGLILAATAVLAVSSYLTTPAAIGIAVAGCLAAATLPLTIAELGQEWRRAGTDTRTDTLES